MNLTVESLTFPWPSLFCSAASKTDISKSSWTGEETLYRKPTLFFQIQSSPHQSLFNPIPFYSTNDHEQNSSHLIFHCTLDNSTLSQIIHSSSLFIFLPSTCKDTHLLQLFHIQQIHWHSIDIQLLFIHSYSTEFIWHRTSTLLQLFHRHPKILLFHRSSTFTNSSIHIDTELFSKTSYPSSYSSQSIFHWPWKEHTSSIIYPPFIFNPNSPITIDPDPFPLISLPLAHSQSPIDTYQFHLTLINLHPSDSIHLSLFLPTSTQHFPSHLIHHSPSVYIHLYSNF